MFPVFTVYFIRGADVSESLQFNQIDNIHSTLQTSLLNDFFEDIIDDNYVYILNGNTRKRYCDNCRGLTFENGSLEAVKYNDYSYGNFQVQFLPPSVQRLQIIRCDQRFEISTRKLPRDLTQFTMSENHLFGPIDLTTLPDKLEIYSLSSNELTGPISLTNLPPNLNTIDVSKNTISQKTVFYTEIPKGTRCIILSAVNDRSTQVRWIRPVSAQYSIENSRKSIFWPIPKDRIR